MNKPGAALAVHIAMPVVIAVMALVLFAPAGAALARELAQVAAQVQCALAGTAPCSTEK